ncbi:MAG: hypothetical protein WD333_08250, partial [Dehalococcoidia bacterium]
CGTLPVLHVDALDQSPLRVVEAVVAAALFKVGGNATAAISNAMTTNNCAWRLRDVDISSFR